jgi:hypothetical protein
MANAVWTEGNAKLLKTSGGEYRVVGFGLPADVDFSVDGVKMNTCPAALACRGVCYAKQGTYRFKNVVAARQHNLDLSQRADFADLIIADLASMVVKSPRKRKPYNVVRLHDAGDFYSQSYLDAWCKVAAAYPDVIFYAYTKSLHLDLSAAPSNLRITQSLGGKYDNLVNLGKPHSRIFSNDEARQAAFYIDGNVNDIPAIEGDIAIGLVYHGGRNLTTAQEKFFG